MSAFDEGCEDCYTVDKDNLDKLQDWLVENS